jgi:hypothetical protein
MAWAKAQITGQTLLAIIRNVTGYLGLADMPSNTIK